jgi:uncharacterized protein (DUF983 family)
MAQPGAWEAGLRGRCPRCGEGGLYAGFLRMATACPVCALSFSDADSGDGPAFFVMFAVGWIVVPLAFVLYFGLNLGLALSLALTTAATIALSLAFLRMAKGVLFALQWRHRLDGGA